MDHFPQLSPHCKCYFCYLVFEIDRFVILSNSQRIINMTQILDINKQVQKTKHKHTLDYIIHDIV